MKIIKNNSNNISITASTNRGTIFYQTNLNDVIEALTNKDGNLFAIHQLKEYGWDAIDFNKHLFGSYVDGDDIYICNTDGQDIQVGDDFVDPEKAFEKYSAEDLSNFIQVADDKTIIENITEYEVTIKDAESIAIDLLSSGVSLVDVLEAAQDCGIFK